MKKHFRVSTALLAAVLLAGCGKDTGEEQSAKKATESKTKQNVEETTEEVTEAATKIYNSNTTNRFLKTEANAICSSINI